MTTFTVSRTTSPSFAGTVGAIAQSAALRVWTILRALKNRHDATMLAGFDDRMLADIGLTRSDVRDAYSVPLWRDPTVLLRNRVSDRHRYRHGAPFGLGGLVVKSPALVPENGFTVPPTDRPARQTV
jgi:uncharacterized protein YjiS (DUF1127 family)